jgi:hypothetical protein
VTVSDEGLSQVRRAISDAAPAVPRRQWQDLDLDLPATLEELREWLADEHQAANTFPRHWVSLLDDVLWAVDGTGPLLRAALLRDHPRTVEELRACRAVLKRAKQPPDASLRQRIARASQYLGRRLADEKVLVAAFRDLLNAIEPDHARARARSLVALSVEAGHDGKWFPSRLRNVLADDAFAIAAERGEPPPEDSHQPAGATPDERTALAEGLLSRPARRSDVVVWLRFLSANLRWPPVLEIGDHVTLFDARWLRSVLANDPTQLEGRAPEAITEDEGHSVGLFVGDDERSEDRPAVFIRVVVAGSTGSSARATARRTADTLSGIASLYGTPPRLWQLDDSYVTVTGHGGAGYSLSAPPPSELSVDDSIALDNDHTGRTLADMAAKLGTRLPVRDPAVIHAATLLSWLRGARLAAGPPRLLLCDRVVEQVSGWAGFGDPHRFVSEFLRVSWAVSRVRKQVADAAFAAAWDLRRGDNSSLAAEFADDSVGFGGSVNLKRFLEVIPEVATALGGKSGVRERIHRTHSLVRTPAASAACLRSLFEDFDRREGRRRRIRNTLVHGGPIVERTVEATVDFAEKLAVQALGTSIDGRLSDRNLIDHFLDERALLEGVEHRLRDGDSLSDALFWERA